MKIKHLILTLGLCLAAGTAMAAEPFLNLTPTPKSIVQNEGELTLRQGMTVSSTGLDEAMTAEVTRFIDAINAATGLGFAPATGADADFVIKTSDSCAPEGYRLNVTAEGATIDASTPAGLFYAFQTVKKLLPANVMAGVKREAAYSLPAVTIDDEPRMGYRGFMLDVCRHFFTVDEVKRMLDVMAFYKMNKFHWHLTEDQGWRIEMPNWPRLTTVGATASNCTFTDYKAKTEYLINRQYGPYYYTVQDLKDVVDYAAKLHIDIVPEVEMPGHFKAVNTAYPELSCTPDGSHSVATTGGVYNDVLNVASPIAEQFYKDVIDHLAEIFPYELIHIGGDECPTSAWQNNDECKAKVKELGFTGSNDDQKFRKLQSWFTKKVADYAATKGRKIACWNESVTAGGTDLDVIKQTGATIYCWTGPDNAVNVATNNGLPVVYTPYSSTSAEKGSFYINRKQDPNDPPANGNTWDTVDKVYRTNPFTTNALNNHSDLCAGVQGTFWTERVSDREYLEWLALPRLLAIAEIGWTPHEKKDWTSFQKRMSLDRELLDLRDYKYSPHFMLDYEAPTYELEAFTPMAPLADGTYVIRNEKLGLYMTDDIAGGAVMSNSASPWDNTIWNISGATANNETGTQAVTIKNRTTSRGITGAAAFNNPAARLIQLGADNMKPLTVGSLGNGTVKLMVDGFTLWPIEATSPNNPSTVTSGNNVSADNDASDMQAVRWIIERVTPTSFVCTDTDGNELFTGVRGVADGADLKAMAPEIKNFTVRTATAEGDGTVKCVYERTGVTVTTRIRLENGALIEPIKEQTVAPGEKVAVNAPVYDKYYTFKSSSVDATEVTPTADMTIDLVYSTEAFPGVKEPAGAVSEIEPGMVYLIHDDHADRAAYRFGNSSKKIAGTFTCTNRDPYHVWSFETKDDAMAIKNIGWGLYAQNVSNNAQGSLGKTAKKYELTCNAGSWTIKNANNNQAWDGQGNLNMVGWNAPGHPHSIMEFIVEPYFQVTVNSVSTDGKSLASTSAYVKAGSTYTVTIPERNGYEFESIAGYTEGAPVEANTTVTLTYKPTQSGINEVDADAAPAGIYDLQGRRLNSATNGGVYIIDGQKTIVR